MLGELELAWRLLPNEFIAVTGTNGKTTTVHWIGHIYREAGLPVAVAGNVGDALSGLVGQVDPDVTVVCETSSFQLEDTLAFAPEAAVLLNITPDHLDRHGTLEAYREAKLRIFAHQGGGDLAVLGAGVHDVPTAAGVRRVRCGVSSTPVTMPAAADVPTATPVAVPVAGDAATAAAVAGSAAVECALYDGRLWWQGQPLLAADELRLRGRAQLAERDGRRRRLPRARARPGRRARRVCAASRASRTAWRRSRAATACSTSTTPRPRTSRARSSRCGRSRPARVHLILGGQGKGQDFAALREPVAAALPRRLPDRRRRAC